MVGHVSVIDNMAVPRKRTPSRLAFVVVTVFMFVMILSAADSIGFVPYYVDGTEPTRSRVAIANLPELGENELAPVPQPDAIAVPTRIKSTVINLDLPVQDSNTRDIDELNEMLKDGPVRYVDSAKLGEKGNIIIFGHSSQLPVVNNRMYKAFNRVSEFKPGDTITLEGGGKEFVYSVRSVEKVDANEGVISLTKESSLLTLVTCDTLTGKSARFVLEAELVGSY